MNRKVELAETATAAHQSKGIWRVRLIEADVQGSSGYYPADVLKRDGSRAFPKGTHVYLDHPTESEEWDRPERSVKDLAAVLIEDASYEEDGHDGRGLFARMQVFPDHKERVSAWAEHASVGMSIRATGLTEHEESTGRTVVTELIHGQSVDIVTRAGAGGRLIAMTESARQGAGEQQLFATLSESDKKGMQVLFESVHTLTSKVEELQAELSEAKKDQAKNEEPVGLTPGELYAKLADSGLPSVLAKRVADEYTPGTDVEAKVAEYKALVDEVNSSVPAQEQSEETTTEDTQPEPETAMAESKRNAGVGYVAESHNGAAFDNTLLELFGG